jgi:sterol desaturase/sphingolipid hydroxylase (fatty acid hydroxylase superfamily)
MPVHETIATRCVAVCLALAYFGGIHQWFTEARWNAIVSWCGSENQTYFFGTQLCHIIAYFGLNLMLLVLYVGHFPWVERYKTVKEPWGWLDPRAEERRKFWSLLWFGLLMVLVNNLCVALPLNYVTSWLPLRYPSSWADFPSLWTIAWQVPVCLVIEDACFYWSHRFSSW